jgi:hypothetical protein
MRGQIADQILVRDQVGQARLRHLVGQHDDVLDPRQRRRQLLQHRDLVGLDEDRAIVGVVDDVRQVVRRQPDVERVEHALGTRHREVALEVPVPVPGQGRDSLAGRDAQAIERVHQLLAAARERTERGAVQLAAQLSADDLDVAGVGLDVLEQQP